PRIAVHIDRVRFYVEGVQDAALHGPGRVVLRQQPGRVVVRDLQVRDRYPGVADPAAGPARRVRLPGLLQPPASTLHTRVPYSARSPCDVPSRYRTRGTKPRCPVPGWNFKGGERPIYVSMEHSKWQPPEPWRSEFQRVHLRQLEYANSTGAVLFNGDLIRVLDFTPLRDERLGTRGLRLTCQPTDYFTFVSSNHCWDLIGTEAGQRLQAMESQHVTNLRRSVLANPLTVSVSLVIRDAHREWLLVQHRNRDKNFHGKQDFVSAAAGMVSATRDVRSGEIDVYATVCNELREETGVHAREDQVLFLGLLRETSLREIGLVAEVALDGDPHELLGPRADPFESTGFELCEATPEA